MAKVKWIVPYIIISINIIWNILFFFKILTAKILLISIFFVFLFGASLQVITSTHVAIDVIRTNSGFSRTLGDLWVLTIQLLTKHPNSPLLPSINLSHWAQQVYAAGIIKSKLAQCILEQAFSVQQKLLLLFGTETW